MRAADVIAGSEEDYFVFGRALDGFVIPGWSEGPDPESRDSGFDALHRPGMTERHTRGREGTGRPRALFRRRLGRLLHP